MKLYLPKDEEWNLFSIIKSSSGVVIPLGNFDFKEHHLTICIKEVGEEIGLNIHITNDNDRKQIFNTYFQFDVKDLEEKIISKIEKFYDNELKHFLKREFKDDHILYCLDCYYEDKFKQTNFSKKNSIKTTLSQISEIDDKEIEETVKNYPICDNQKHRMLYNLENKIHYRNFLGYLLTFEEQEVLMEKILLFIEKEFGVFFENIEKTIKDIQNIIKD